MFTPEFEKSTIYLGKGERPSVAARKRRAVLALESFDDVADVEIKKIPKNPTQRRNITEALKSNYLFKSLDKSAIELAVDAMAPKTVVAGEYILKQGASGDDFFVLEQGSVDFLVNDVKVGNTSGPATFGELALIYNSPRAADVKATSTCQLWFIKRLTFRKALSSATTSKHLEHIKLLSEVPSLKELSTNQINTLAGALIEKTYAKGDVIIKQGDIGDVFYIISSGKVDVTIAPSNKLVKTLNRGQFFGERALIKNVPRDATCTASIATSCLTLEKRHFNSLLGSLDEIKSISKQREREVGISSPKVSQTRKARRATHHTFAEGLSEFKILRIIGQGTFGRVKLAQHKPTSQVMAMKCLQKQQIWKQKQVTNVLNEKDAMEHIDHPFVLKLLGTYQDKDQLYFFLEIVHGGELWSLLYQSRALPRVRTRIFLLRDETLIPLLNGVIRTRHNSHTRTNRYDWEDSRRSRHESTLQRSFLESHTFTTAGTCIET